MLASSLKTGSEVFELPHPLAPPGAPMVELPRTRSRAAPSPCTSSTAPWSPLAVMAGNLLFLQPRGVWPRQVPLSVPGGLVPLILSTLMLPLEIVLVPTFLVVRGLGPGEQLRGTHRSARRGRLRHLPHAPVHQGPAGLPHRGGPARRLQRARHLLAHHPAQLQARPGRAGAPHVPRQLGPVPVAPHRGLEGHAEDLPPRAWPRWRASTRPPTTRSWPSPSSA